MDSLRNILNAHFSRYPTMQVQDVYKLLHQAALGSEHAVFDELAAQNRLERELAEMGAGPSEPLPDPISPDGGVARIHLRPYIRAGKKPQALLAAFVRTAQEWRGSKADLRAYGQATALCAEKESWPIRRFEIETFFAKMEEMDFPAAHHSAVFTDTYRPAYRVVAARFLEEA